MSTRVRSSMSIFSKYSDKTGRTPRQIIFFAGCTNKFFCLFCCASAHLVIRTELRGAVFVSQSLSLEFKFQITENGLKVIYATKVVTKITYQDYSRISLKLGDAMLVSSEMSLIISLGITIMDGKYSVIQVYHV